jgi:gliding motility-associated-like protein
MRLQTSRLLLLFIAILDFTLARGQSINCEGSLGDPVITETFGSGPNPGNALQAGMTNMSFSSYCPNDGSYTIVNATNIYGGATGNCHPEAWQAVIHDHTGDANGYMMMINASYTPSIFFTKTTPAVLCENTKYEFSAYILNLMRAGSSGIRPNIKFTIETVDGTVLESLVTGDILESNSGDDWIRKSFFFKTLPNTSQVVLKMTNEAPGGGGNDLLIDDINFRACGPIIQTGFTTVDANQPQNQCAGEAKLYIIKSKIGDGYTNPKKQWQQNKNDGKGWVDIAGQTGDNYTFTLSDNNLNVYQYRLAAAEGANIGSPSCRVFSDPLTITVNPYPQVPDIGSQSACEGSTLSIQAVGGVVYEWHGPGITQVNKNQNPLVLENITTGIQGNYSVDVTSAGGCTSSSNIFPVTVNLKPVITVSNPATICKGNSTTISASAPGATSYSWSPVAGLSDPTSSNPVVSPTDTTTYTVTVRNANDCSDTKTVTVNVLGNPLADAGADKKIFEGQSVMLTATAKNANIFNWTPTIGLSDPHVLNPIASPGDDITYHLTVSSAQNCGQDTSSVFVKVYHKIVIPNAFSPNADGHNDFWDIEALVTYPESVLTVFNRYGQQVFKSIGYDKPWKGTYNGAKLPSGTYYYIIDLKVGSPKLTGWVLIVN